MPNPLRDADEDGHFLAPGSCPRCGAPAAGKGSWNTLGTCHFCDDTCCDRCTVQITVDTAGNPDPEGKRTVMVCGKCTEAFSDLLMDEGFVVEVLN